MRCRYELAGMTVGEWSYFAVEPSWVSTNHPETQLKVAERRRTPHLAKSKHLAPLRSAKCKILRPLPQGERNRGEWCEGSVGIKKRRPEAPFVSREFRKLRRVCGGAVLLRR